MAEKYEQVLDTLRRLDEEKLEEADAAYEEQNAWLQNIILASLERVKRIRLTQQPTAKATNAVQMPTKQKAAGANKRGKAKRPAVTVLETVAEEEEELEENVAGNKNEVIEQKEEDDEEEAIEEHTTNRRKGAKAAGSQARSTRQKRAASKPAIAESTEPPKRTTRSRAQPLAEAFPSPPRVRRTRAKKAKIESPAPEESHHAVEPENRATKDSIHASSLASDTALDNPAQPSQDKCRSVAQEATDDPTHAPDGIYSSEAAVDRPAEPIDAEESSKAGTPVDAAVADEETTSAEGRLGPQAQHTLEERPTQDQTIAASVLAQSPVPEIEPTPENGKGRPEAYLPEPAQENLSSPLLTPAVQILQQRGYNTRSRSTQLKPPESSARSDNEAAVEVRDSETEPVTPAESLQTSLNEQLMQPEQRGLSEGPGVRTHEAKFAEREDKVSGADLHAEPEGVVLEEMPVSEIQNVDSPDRDSIGQESWQPGEFAGNVSRNDKGMAVAKHPEPERDMAEDEKENVAPVPHEEESIVQHLPDPGEPDQTSPEQPLQADIDQIQELSQAQAVELEDCSGELCESLEVPPEPSSIAMQKRASQEAAEAATDPLAVADLQDRHTAVEPVSEQAGALPRVAAEIVTTSKSDSQPQQSNDKIKVADKKFVGPNLVTSHRSLLPVKSSTQAQMPAAGKKGPEVDALKAAEQARRKEAAREAEKQRQRELLKKQKADRAKHAQQVKANQEEAQRRAAEEGKKREEAARRKEEEAAARRKAREEAEKKEKEDKQKRLEDAKAKKRQEELRKQEETKKRAREQEHKSLQKPGLQEQNENKRPKVADFFAKAAALMAPVKSAAPSTQPLATEVAQLSMQRLPSAELPATSSSLFQQRSQAAADLAPVPEGVESIEIAPYRSDGESDSEEEDGQTIPAWAQDANLRLEIRGQQRLDPDELFQQHEKTCSLDEVFASIRGPDMKRDLTRRTSTGNWLEDRVTWKEEMKYKKAMGYM